MEKRILPKDIRFVAGIVEPVTRYNRRQLLQRYIVARALLESGQECFGDMQPATRTSCNECKKLSLNSTDRLCSALSRLRSIENAGNIGE